jgi:deoxyhypusine synthase
MNGSKEGVESAINNVMQASNKEATSQLSSSHEIRGYDLNQGIDFSSILSSYMTTGFQATNFAKAVNEVNRMVLI